LTTLPLVMDRDSRPVWYAAYGSNCSETRLLAYLAGSRAPASTFVETGATDTTPPSASAACELPPRVRFAGESRKWGGGFARLEHSETSPPSLGRRYLITWSQFDDLVAQESRRPSVPLPIADLEPGVHHLVGDGAYDNLLALPPVNGVPVVTFTAPTPPEVLEPAAPSPAYLGTIVRGLADVHPLSAAEIASRLLLSPGIAPVWELDAITALITSRTDQ
jgi:hypothetical protein